MFSKLAIYVVFLVSKLSVSREGGYSKLFFMLYWENEASDLSYFKSQVHFFVTWAFNLKRNKYAIILYLIHSYLYDKGRAFKQKPIKTLIFHNIFSSALFKLQQINLCSSFMINTIYKIVFTMNFFFEAYKSIEYETYELVYGRGGRDVINFIDVFVISYNPHIITGIVKYSYHIHVRLSTN